MHVLVRESAGLDDAAPAEDLGLAPADLVVLSFSDSDLGTLAAMWHAWGHDRPTMRLVPLARLRHPMSVDLFCDATLPGSRAVLVRLLGGLDYWRYGCEEVASRCRALGIPLAIVAGDGRPDPRLDAYATLPHEALAAIEALLDTGGIDNCRAALTGLLACAPDAPIATVFPAPVALPPFGVHQCAGEGVTPIATNLAGCNRHRFANGASPVTPLEGRVPPDLPDFTVKMRWEVEHEAPDRAMTAWATAVVVCYRSVVLAGDTAPIDVLATALAERGLACTVLYVPSLKAPDAARWIRRELACRAPDVIVNATAFSARGDDSPSPLDFADCPVLQVVMAQSSAEGWSASGRGLGAADLAMHVALPEMDGRISAGVISFKQTGDGLGEDGASELGFAPLRHAPYEAGIVHAADLASNWARLRKRAVGKRTVALILSTYPGRPDQIAHAVGLDGPASAAAIIAALNHAGYACADAPVTGRDVIARVADGAAITYSVTDYATAFARLPAAFRDSITAAWGVPGDDPSVRDGEFQLGVRRHGNLILALQPERGETSDRKAQYHDPATPPRHGYIAFYLWLRDVARIDALCHLGAHGTLEWLPGKAVALAPECAPQSVLGAVPVIYPFIVNDPGEAVQAKRRIGAVTLGHMTPPLVASQFDDRLREVERLVDEFSSADGLDPRRRTQLMRAVCDAVARAGLSEVCGLAPGMTDADTIAAIDAFLCDVKELSIRDGMHILDETEIDAILRALDGRFIAPGPSGSPSRGRADVQPTGRNMYGLDPRGVPTPTAMDNGTRAAHAIMDRYAEDHGEWPRSIVLDLWGSATLRTGGEEFATALALLGVKPTWDPGSFRVSGYEIIPPPLLDRPRVDVTVRISGLFRDVFATQLTLFHAAVQHVSALAEDAEFNPLAASRASRTNRAAPVPTDRIFGPAAGSYGAGVMGAIDSGTWTTSADLGQMYLAQSATPYRGEVSAFDGGATDTAGSFAERVQTANAFVHIQDHRDTDLLTGADYAAHEGGFAAAARSLGNSDIALYHGDTGSPETPRVRTLDEECARIIAGRAVSPRWIAGQMRHGFRGAAEIAATLDAAFAFAATSGSVTTAGFERLYEAYLGNEEVARFLLAENPAAHRAICARFEEAIARGLWKPRRNDVTPLAPAFLSEAAQ